MHEFWQHPQLAAREPLARGRLAGRPGAGAAAARHLGRRRGPRMDPVPALGQHTDAMLAELGYDAEAIAALRAAQGHLRRTHDPAQLPVRARRPCRALRQGAGQRRRCGGAGPGGRGRAARTRPLARAAVARYLAAADAALRRAWWCASTTSGTPWFDDDLAMLAAASAHGVMLPKAETRGRHGARLRAALPRHRRAGADRKRARRAQRRSAGRRADGVQRLVFGTIDFALDLDLVGRRWPARIGLDAAASRLALASRAAGSAAAGGRRHARHRR